MSLLDSLPHRCTIARIVRSNDGMGGNLFGVVIEQTEVECWMQQLSSSEKIAYEKREISVSVKIYFASDPGVTERHRVLITEMNGITMPGNLDITDVQNTDTFDVKSGTEPDAGAGLSILYKIICGRESGDTQ